MYKTVYRLDLQRHRLQLRSRYVQIVDRCELNYSLGFRKLICRLRWKIINFLWIMQAALGQILEANGLFGNRRTNRAAIIMPWWMNWGSVLIRTLLKTRLRTKLSFPRQNVRLRTKKGKLNWCWSNDGHWWNRLSSVWVAINLILKFDTRKVHAIKYLHRTVTSNISCLQKALWYSYPFQIFFYALNDNRTSKESI